MEVNGYLHAWLACPWGKSRRYPLNRRLDGTYNYSGSFGEEKYIFLPGIEPRIAQLVNWSL
jgi:hypothetical protein